MPIIGAEVEIEVAVAVDVDEGWPAVAASDHEVLGDRVREGWNGGSSGVLEIVE